MKYFIWFSHYIYNSLRNTRFIKIPLKNYFFRFQLTGSFPFAFKYSFVWEKHFELKNFVHENGDGWAHFIILCFFLSISDSFFWAKFPHNRKTQFTVFSETNLITLSVNMSQPNFEWDPALWALEYNFVVLILNNLFKLNHIDLLYS